MKTRTEVLPAAVRWRVLAVIITVSAAALMGGAKAQHVEDYPMMMGGEWIRGPNLTDPEGNFQARQEHAVVELNGFVYLVNGFVPVQPPPEPSEDEPEPDLFEPVNEVMVFVPAGHPFGADSVQGSWQHLSEASWFPEPHHHHIIFTVHEGRIWSFGGHAMAFEPTDPVYVFTPESGGSPEGSWERHPR